MASSDFVNYAIRPNKTVERKVVFEILSALTPIYDFSKYRYIGFGAVWFVDFVLAHKYLFIEDMISIEKDEYIARRAEFNKPYACVRIEAGESDNILPELLYDECPFLIWLDYDTSLDGPVLQDISTFCQRAQTGSLVIATINAHRNSLPNKDPEDHELKDLEERLRYFAGDLVPQALPKEAVQASGYPGFLASLLFRHMRRQVRKAGREDDWIIPLFNIRYKDNAPMITVGAVIDHQERAEKISEVLEGKNTIPRMDDSEQISIEVPPLTLKEKATLDQLMPCGDAPIEDVVRKFGDRLKPTQIEAYRRFYRYYPTFGEVTI